MKFRFSLFLIIFLFLNFFLISRVQAFGIMPAKILITAERGESKLIQLKVINDEKIDNNYEIAVFDIDQAEDGSLNLLTSEDMKKIIVPLEKNIFLKAGEEKIINFSLIIPNDFYVGSHFAGLSVTQISSKNVQTQLLSILDLEIAGQVQEKFSLLKFITNKKIFFNNDFSFYLALKNEGNVATPFAGEIKLRNIFKQEKFSQKLNLGDKIFAGAIRNSDIDIEKNNNIFWPGFYHAEIAIDYGLTGQKINSQIDFVYLPFWSIGLILILIISLIGFIFYKRTKYEK
ncbi:MAG: hypothetical protein WC414_01375 [Patescibacteria group bacterium]